MRNGSIIGEKELAQVTHFVYNQDMQEDRRELKKMGGAEDPTSAFLRCRPPQPSAGLSVLSPSQLISSEKWNQVGPGS